MAVTCDTPFSVRDVKYLMMRDPLPDLMDSMSLLILVVDDEPDVEVLFRQHFRRDLRARRFTMEFAQIGFGRTSAHCGRDITHLNALRHQHAGDERS